MTTQTDSAVAAPQKTIFIKRTFNLPLYKVWEAWTVPEVFIKWWGPEGYTCPYCNIDFKPGGKYLAAMRSPEGQDIWSTGSYKEIIPNKKIVYTDSFANSEGNIVPSSYYKMPPMPLELRVTVELEEVNGKTIMSLTHVSLPEDMYDDCIKGWQSSFDKIEKNVK